MGGNDECDQVKVGRPQSSDEHFLNGISYTKWKLLECVNQGLRF